MAEKTITIITPTTGQKDRLQKLHESIENQNVPYVHILLWDNKREEGAENNDNLRYHTVTKFGITYNIVIPDNMVNGIAAGSALRSIGLVASNTPYVTFADDDVWYEPEHFQSLLYNIKQKEWAYCKRKIWVEKNNQLEYIGVDEFESVGDDPSRKVPYQMVDNSSMIFTRKFGVSAACLYRETNEYNDDRLMYAFLNRYAGEPGKTNLATVNQICPKRLELMFRENCVKS